MNFKSGIFSLVVKSNKLSAYACQGVEILLPKIEIVDTELAVLNLHVSIHDWYVGLHT